MYCITYSGIKWDLMNPKSEDVRIVDIAHALSNICRFNGHVKKFYSVAEHCVRVSDQLILGPMKLIGLMHDAAEAYLGDVIAPLKPYIKNYNTIEAATEQAIATGLGGLVAETFHLPAIKHYDRVLLATEGRDLLKPSWNDIHTSWDKEPLPKPLPGRIKPWTAAQARHEFLEKYAELTGTTVSEVWEEHWREEAHEPISNS